jgi:hypothetical protein
MFTALTCFTAVALVYLTLGAYGATKTRTHSLCPNCNAHNHVWKAYYLQPSSGRRILAEYDTFFGLWLAAGIALIAAGFFIDLFMIVQWLPREAIYLEWLLILVEVGLVTAVLVRVVLVLRGRGKNLIGMFKCVRCGWVWVIEPAGEAGVKGDPKGDPKGF